MKGISMSCGLVGIDLVTQLPLLPTDDQLKVQQKVGNSELRSILDYPFFSSVMVMCFWLGVGKVQ